MRASSFLLVGILGLAAMPSAAHEGGVHLKGVVGAIDAQQITVQAADGHKSDVRITERTQFIRGKEQGKREDLKPGDRVVVHARKRGDQLEATEIRFAAQRQPGKQSTP